MLHFITASTPPGGIRFKLPGTEVQTGTTFPKITTWALVNMKDSKRWLWMDRKHCQCKSYCQAHTKSRGWNRFWKMDLPQFGAHRRLGQDTDGLVCDKVGEGWRMQEVNSAYMHLPLLASRMPTSSWHMSTTWGKRVKAGKVQQEGMIPMQPMTMFITTFSPFLDHHHHQDPASSVSARQWLASAGRLESEGRYSQIQPVQQRRWPGKQVLLRFWKHTLMETLKRVEVVLQGGWWRLYLAAFWDACWQLGQPHMACSWYTGIPQPSAPWDVSWYQGRQNRKRLAKLEVADT